MLGSLALTERAIADDGILLLGSQSVSTDFTAGQTGTYIGITSAEMNAIASKASIAVGILVGIIDATLEFTQSSAATRFATGISGQVFSTIQTSEGLRYATGISEQDAAFIQSSAASSVLGGVSEQDAAFIVSALGGAITNNPASLEAVFIQTTNGIAVRGGISEQDASFTQATFGSKVFEAEPLQISGVFIQTTDGRLYWDIWTGSPGNSPQENWVQISPTGGTWTEINAGAIISTWTEKVV
jgi:hypothetical protein